MYILTTTNNEYTEFLVRVQAVDGSQVQFST